MIKFAKTFLKKILDIDKLENNLDEVIKQKSELEEELCKERKDKLAISKVCSQVSLDHVLDQDILEWLSSNLNQSKQEAVISALKSKEIVQRYGFEKYVPAKQQGEPRSVITIDEFRKQPEMYWYKLAKGWINFPLDLNLTKIQEKISDIHMNVFFSDSYLGFSSRTVFRGIEESEVNQFCDAMTVTELQKMANNGTTYMDTPDFLHNYSRLMLFIEENQNIRPDAKKCAQNAFSLAYISYLSAMELIGTSQIGDLEELLDSDSEKTQSDLVKNTDSNMIYNIKRTLLTDMNNTTYQDINKLLMLRSKERFTGLASSLTTKILQDDNAKKGFTDNIDKPLEEYSVGESLLLACYFARRVITCYKKDEDFVKDPFNTSVTGKCTDYTGLALHYLREFLVVKQPDKFKNWIFGYDDTQVGDYSHCFLKAIYINPDLSTRVYFADPTKLANNGIRELRNTKDLAKNLNSSYIPLKINRDVEDVMQAADERM